MTAVFRCAACENLLTRPLREVPLPDPADLRAPYEMDDGEPCPPHVAAGTFAYDPEPSAFAWTEAREDGAVVGVRGGPRNSVVLNAADVIGLKPITHLGRRNGCCGPDGMDGANLACARCGAEVAIESADCWTLQDVVLDPEAVRTDPVPPTDMR